MPWARVPTISRFRGVQIRMFFDEGVHEGRPHFHAVYAEDFAVFDVSSQERIAGELPPRIERWVRRWARLHRQELLENWERARSETALCPIPPLK